MKLDGFYIRRYRNVARQFLPFSGLHVLAGRNGAGKSTVLSAVALLGDHPNPFAGLTELGLEATESRRLGHPLGIIGIGAVRIYELDDDLSGDYIVEDALRSQAVLELVFSTLGPAALRNVVSVGDDWYDGPPTAHLDMEQLRVELDRASRLFRHCNLLSYLATEIPEDATTRFSEYTLPLFEGELSEQIRAYEPTGWMLRYQQTAEELEALLVKARRIGWSKTGGYQGLVIDRSEISSELGDALNEIAYGYEDQPAILDEPGFFEAGQPLGGDSNWYHMLDELLVSLPGYRPATVPPVVKIARQWATREQVLFLSLSPDVGQGPPFDGEVEYVGPIDVGSVRREIRKEALEFPSSDLARRQARLSWSTFERLSSEYHVGPLVERKSTFHGAPSYGPYGFAAVVASGDAAGLAEEVETALPSLYRQVWGFVNFVAFKLRTVNKLMPPEQQFIFGTDHTGRDSALRLAVSMGYVDRGKVPDNPWVVPVHTALHGWTLTDAYVKRPGVQTVCELLTYKANDIAPGFVLQGGLISIKPRTIPGAEAGSNHIVIRYDGKDLGDLPAGTARWVAMTVRIAGRLLLESKLLLREVWGSDEAEKQSHLNGLAPELLAALEKIEGGIDSYGILQHAFEILKSDNPYPKFEITPGEHGDTVLLVDEPELHLHQDALLDVRKWLRDRTSEREITAMVATHSPIFMDYRPEEATVHGLLTMPDGDAVLADMTSGLDDWLEGDAEALGIASLDELFTYRGFLLVEGKHDEQVLRHFYSDELARKRIGVIPMWGTRDKLDLTEARYLQLTRRPIAMLFDNIPEGNPTGRDMTSEQRDLSEFVESFQREGIQFLGDGHGLQDIIYTLPEAAVQRYCEERTGTSPPGGVWAEIGEKMRTELRYEKSAVKKKKAEEMLGLGPTRHGLSANNFIGPVLDQCKDGDRPHETLEKAMLRIWGFFDSHDRYS